MEKTRLRMIPGLRAAAFRFMEMDAMTTTTPPAPTLVVAATRTSASAIPWYLWCALAASFTVAFGAHWDIAWHRSNGRDTFWSPPHMAIYLSAVLAAIVAGWCILRSTFGRGTGEAGVRVLAFRGPLGAFVMAWGGIAMLTSAPFDDWWHNAYGLDVRILSPPHVALATGIAAIHAGALIFLASRMNNAAEATRGRLQTLFLFSGGMIVVAILTLFMERTIRIEMHLASFYMWVAGFAPLLLALVARGSGHRWGSTIATAIYSVFVLLLLWLMPLVPAEPKLGPVFLRVRNLIPPEFPLLIIVPALALDSLWAHAARRGWGRGLQAAVGGTLFSALFFAVQWPFASFLMSPAARNPFFGAIYFNYNTPPTSLYFRHQFLPHQATPGAFLTGAAFTIAIAIAGTWLGISWGEWTRRVRR